jgi:hypothetical protein
MAADNPLGPLPMTTASYDEAMADGDRDSAMVLHFPLAGCRSNEIYDIQWMPYCFIIAMMVPACGE